MPARLKVGAQKAGHDSQNRQEELQLERSNRSMHAQTWGASSARGLLEWTVSQHRRKERRARAFLGDNWKGGRGVWGGTDIHT